MKKIILAAALLLLAAPAFAQAPPDAATPPAAATPDGGGGDWMNYKNPYAAETGDLSNPHRTNEEIIAWASKAVANSLSFKMGSFKDDIANARKYFVQAGWKVYAAYLKDLKVLDVAKSGKYSIATFADGDPMITGSSVQNGAWHWQVDIPS